MKKHLIITTLLLSTLLVGCDNKEETKHADSSNTQEIQKKVPPATVANDPEVTKLIMEATKKIAEQKPQEALDVYGKALEKKPEGLQAVGVYGGRAAVYMSMQNYDKSIEDYTQAINFADANLNKGAQTLGRATAYRLKGDCAKANEDYQAACKLGQKAGCNMKC